MQGVSDSCTKLSGIQMVQLIPWFVWPFEHHPKMDGIQIYLVWYLDDYCICSQYGKIGV